MQADDKGPNKTLKEDRETVPVNRVLEGTRRLEKQSEAELRCKLLISPLLSFGT